jgi:hypothetical protein
MANLTEPCCQASDLLFCTLFCSADCPYKCCQYIFLNKTGNIASFYFKKKKRIDRFISGNRLKTDTYAPISSWNATILGATTGRPGHMPTIGHTHPTGDSSDFDDKHHKRNMLGLRRPSPLKRPSFAIHHRHMDALHRSSDSTATQRSTRELNFSV